MPIQNLSELRKSNDNRPAPEDHFIIEVDDVVTFAARGEFGEVTGTGVVVRLLKNGEATIEMNGQRYKTRNYELMSKAC